MKNQEKQTKEILKITCDRQKFLDYLYDQRYSQLSKQDLLASGFEVKDFNNENLIFCHKQFEGINANKSSITMKGNGNILILEGGGGLKDLLLTLGGVILFATYLIHVTGSELSSICITTITFF